MRTNFPYNSNMDVLGGSSLFGVGARTPTLLAIALLGETHASEIARALGRSRSGIKDVVDGLERDGVIVGSDVGQTRQIRLNPRYFAAEELRALLMRIAAEDRELQRRLAATRRRPRKAGKAL
jgi:biotin operon repressor